VFAHDWQFATGEPLELPVREEDRPGCATVAIVPSGPDQSRNARPLNYFTGITSAQRSVWLTSPYFIPDEAILSALASAALKGVDVRILVPAESDVLLVGPAGRSYYQQLLYVGIRIFEYLPSMLHAKTMVIDEHLALVGSANIDMRSFTLNFEVGALIDDPARGRGRCAIASTRRPKRAAKSPWRRSSAGRWRNACSTARHDSFRRCFETFLSRTQQPLGITGRRNTRPGGYRWPQSRIFRPPHPRAAPAPGIEDAKACQGCHDRGARKN